MYLKEEKMRIILVRHGESVDDTINCYGGAANFPLSDSGKRAAEEVAQMFSDVLVDKIYSSPLKRAMQTAEAIDFVKQCGIETIADLRERNSYGILSGCNKDDSKEIYGYLLKEFKGKPGDYYSDELLLGAEPVPDFDERIRKALYDVAHDARKNEYEIVIVVTHGNVTRSIYKNILKFEKKIYLELLAQTIMEYENGKFTLINNEGVYEK